jgi:outer membrane lipoprotein-sorting protein
MKIRFEQRYLMMMIFVVICCLSVSVSSAQTQMSPREMLQKADEARGNAEGIQWEIVIDSIEGGREQHRTLRVNARGYNSLASILAPANVKGQKLLMQDRNMWFTTPGLSKPVPISPRQKLMGGAANGDIASTNYFGDYKITHTVESKVNGEDCLILDLQAVDSRATYDRIKYWISKERLVGLKAEFYTVSGKMFKTATFEYKNTITINEKPREFISKMIITSAIIKEDVTTMHYNNAVLKKVSDATFNLNLLTK